MATTINDEFMLQVATEQAWQKLAKDYAWTEDLLEKYADKLDWKKISSNGAIRWTVPMLRKFSSKLDWKELSENINDEWFTEAHLEAFKDKWDWSYLISLYKLSDRLIDKYTDYIDWAAFIGAEGSYRICGLPRDDSFDAMSFYEKYKEHITMSALHQSDLWDKIVEQRCKQLLAEILS